MCPFVTVRAVLCLMEALVKRVIQAFWVTTVVNWDPQQQQLPKELGTGTFEINIP